MHMSACLQLMCVPLTSLRQLFISLHNVCYALIVSIFNKTSRLNVSPNQIPVSAPVYGVVLG